MANSFAHSSDSAVTKAEFQKEIWRLSSKIKMLEKRNSEIINSSISSQKLVDSIGLQLSLTKTTINRVKDSLNIVRSNASTSYFQTSQDIQGINNTISTRSLYWVFGFLLVALLSLLVFLVLRLKLSSTTRNLDSQIVKTFENLQAQGIKLDSKLVEILQSQLSLLNNEDRVEPKTKDEADHQLPLKVGEEIHRMRKRILNMPQEIKGLNALTNSLQRLEEEFNNSGYFIEDLMNKKYVDGMKVEARFVDNPDIPKGEEIITDVLRPQIMFKGIVVQFAKVEVGKSY
jgi:hypothetical protein